MQHPYKCEIKIYLNIYLRTERQCSMGNFICHIMYDRGIITCAEMLLCVCTTPLGFPVVPLVYMIKAGSSPEPLGTTELRTNHPYH